jgi:alkylation response protein AidB-like acyl-CoA dehydrogenase
MDVVIDVLAANAEMTEQRNRPTEASLLAARAAGAFALRTPLAYDGSWESATNIARLLADLARGCPSTALIASTCMVSKNMVTFGDFGDAASKELFADPDALFCGAGVPVGSGRSGPDGVRVTGRWTMLSGCEDATWGVFGVMVDDTFSLVLIPMTDLTIDRTWDAAGMRGTGSHSAVADDVLVPAERVAKADFPPDTKTLQLWGLSVLATVVGATFGALDVVNAMFASDRKPFMSSYTRMSESPGARHWLAEATMLTHRAERTMLALASTIDGDAEITARDSSRMQQDRADAGRDCRAAIELMLDLHGASGFTTANPLQRFWRDVSIAGRHPQLNAYLAVEGYGKALTATPTPP